MLTPAGFFARAITAFDATAQECEVFTRDFGIGEWRLRIRFAGPDLVGPLTRAFDHLRLDEPTAAGRRPQSLPADLTVLAWVGTEAPHAPPPADAGRWRMGRNGFIRSLSDERFSALWMFTAGGMQMLDRQGGRAIYWVRNAADLPYWEAGAPMRFLLDGWLADRSWLLAHAAAIGDQRGAILLAGPGGSGKSSTALACLDSGFEYLGDDYVLLNPADGSVRSIYSTGKVDARGLRQLPFLEDHVSNRDQLAREKSLVFVHEAFPHKVRAGALPVRAVVQPTVGSAGNPGCRPVAAARVLKGFAASTMFQGARPAGVTLHMLAQLIRNCPTFELNLAPGSLPDAAELQALFPEDRVLAKRLVSVVVPCYNPGPYLHDALDSLCSQGAARQQGGLEVVVVDDGSDEDIGAALDPFASKLPIRIERQPRSGPSAARNRGLRMSRGEFIAFLDADDLWPAASLDVRVTTLEQHPEVDAVHGRLRNLLRDDTKRETYFGPPRRSFNIGSMLFRRQVFDQAGLLDERLHFSEDVDFLVRLVENGVKRLLVDDICLYYRRHGNGLTGPLRAGERGRAHLQSWARILKRSLDRRRA